MAELALYDVTVRGIPTQMMLTQKDAEEIYGATATLAEDQPVTASAAAPVKKAAHPANKARTPDDKS